MKTTIDKILFTFPSICDTCTQERYDMDLSEDNSEQKLTVIDIFNAGWPICKECGNELTVYNECEVVKNRST